MRATPIAAVAVAMAAACIVACDDATLWEPRDAVPKDHSNPDGWALGPDCIGCKLEQIGLPVWKPAHVVLFSGNVGPTRANRDLLLQAVLAPRHVFNSDAHVFPSAEAHLPPYQDELYDQLDARGITPSQTFDDAHFTAPLGIVMAMTVVPSPDAIEDSSFDFPSGPVIPHFKFPIQVDGDLFRDGRVLDRTLDYPARAHLPQIGSEPAAQGISHLILGFAENSSLAGAPYVPPDGDYEYRVSMIDKMGEGWNVSVPFKVGRGGPGDIPPMPGTGGSTGPGGSGGSAGRGGTGGAGGSPAGGAPGGIGRVSLVPDANGAFDGSNAAGVRGAWWAGGDYYGLDGSAGGGSCSLAGFPPGNCSMINSPPLDQPFAPDVKGAMCTAGVVAPVVTGSDGQPAWSSIWGTIVGFNLAVDDAGVAGPYDAIARKLTGFAFDLDGPGPPGGPWMRVEFATVGTNDGAPYWQGAMSDTSPVQRAGHYEIRWREVGGPLYMGPSAPPFDPTQLTSIRFHVVPNTVVPIPYGFCIRNTAFLTD